MENKTQLRSGYDYTCDRRDTSGVGVNGNISFHIIDPFACYLANKGNEELAAFLGKKADEIRAYLAAMEARV